LAQVDFRDLRTVVAIQTRGREYYPQYIMLFRLELSQDCDNFSHLLDASESDVVNITFSLLCIQINAIYAF